MTKSIKQFIALALVAIILLAILYLLHASGIMSGETMAMVLLFFFGGGLITIIWWLFASESSDLTSEINRDIKKVKNIDTKQKLIKYWTDVTS